MRFALILLGLAASGAFAQALPRPEVCAPKPSATRDAEFREYFKTEGSFASRAGDAPASHVLTDAERLAIYFYTSDGYADVNRALRATDISEIARLQAYIETLSDALNKLPDYHGEVYRLTSLPKQVLAQYQIGAIVQDMAFLSTYRDLRVEAGADRDRHGIYIQSRTGKYIGSHSWFKNEKEVLFRCGTSFRVLDRHERSDGTIVFKLEELL